MRDESDKPLSDEELASSRDGKALISAAVADVHAPQSLREAIERDRELAAARARAPFWRRHRLGLASAGVAAATLAIVAIALETGGTTADPSLTEVYAAARLDPTKRAPAPLGGTPPRLDARVGDLAFPDWEEQFGWKAVGRRDETLAGRRVTTVFYRNPDGARLGYAIVSGDVLGGNPPGLPVTRNGKNYHVARGGERTIVTWDQQGHTCAIVASAAVPTARLIDLVASQDV